MNANLSTVIGSGLCEVSMSELTAIDGGHPASPCWHDSFSAMQPRKVMDGF